MGAGDVERWDARYRGELARSERAPDPFVLAALERLREVPPGTAVDLACGSGRHALELARRGWRVEAWDASSAALEILAERASRAGLSVSASVQDLEVARNPGPTSEFDLAVVVDYLHHPLLARLRELVRPGGHAIVASFTVDRAGEHPSLRHCLERGWLAAGLAGFRTLWHLERGGRAGLLARRTLTRAFLGRVSPTKPPEIPQNRRAAPGIGGSGVASWLVGRRFPARVSGRGSGVRHDRSTYRSNLTMKHLVLASILALGAFAGSASAQLIVANDDTALAGTNAWHVDLSTCTATPLWGGGSEAWGAAADDVNGKIYATDGTPLTVWSYNSPNPPVTLGNPISSVDGASLLFTGLAFDSGTLYGLRSSSSATNPEGVYTIDPDTLIATLILSFGLSTDYDFGGFAYNPVDGLFYGTNDDSTPFGQGVFSIDALGAGAITFVTAYDGGETDVDGAAVGNNKVFAITDDAGDPLYNFDLTTSTWDPAPCTSPMPTTEVFSSGGWAPNLVPGDCADPVTYCTGKINTQGCVPEIGWVGRPDSNGSGQFDITLTNHRIGKFAMVVYSVTGRDNIPFQGGILCIAAPTRRTPVTQTAATGNLIVCPFPPNLNMDEGAASMDFNARIGSGVDPALVAGQLVNAQWWARDSGPETALSNALEFEICP